MGDLVTRREDGGLEISPELLRKLQEQRLRAAATGFVPTTPRFTPLGPYGSVDRSSSLQRRDFNLLRDRRNNSDILKPIHRVRHSQIRAVCQPSSGLPGSVGWRLVHESAPEPGQKAPTGFDAVIRRVKPLIEFPQPRWCPTLADALILLWEDLATINQPCTEPLADPCEEKWLLAWRPIDGALVLPLAQWLVSWRSLVPVWAASVPNTMTMEQELEWLTRKTGLNLRDRAAWLIVRDGIPDRVMDSRDLHVGPMLTSTDIRQVGFWPSYVEDALNLADVWRQVFAYNANYFKQGWMAEFLLGIKGGSAADVQTIVEQLRDNAMGVHNAWIPPVLTLGSDGDLVSIPMKTANSEMAFETLDSRLVSLICALYRMRPEELNAKDWAGGNTPSMSEGSKNEQIELARSDGLRNDVRHLTARCIEPVIRRIHPELRMVWDFGDERAKDVVDLQATAVKGWRTRNEIRMSEGSDPIGFWVEPGQVAKLSAEEQRKYTDNPWNSPADPSFMQQINAQQQAEQQDKMLEQMGGQGGGFDPQAGAPDGGGGVGPEQDDDPWAQFGVPVQPAGLPQEQQDGRGMPLRKAISQTPRIVVRVHRS